VRALVVCAVDQEAAERLIAHFTEGDFLVARHQLPFSAGSMGRQGTSIEVALNPLVVKLGSRLHVFFCHRTLAYLMQIKTAGGFSWECFK
jgi:hypothetical protein